MPFDASALQESLVHNYALKVAGRLRRFHFFLNQLLTLVANDDYTQLLRMAEPIRTFGELISEIQQAGLTADVRDQIVDIYGDANVTSQEINAFVADILDLRNDIRSNSQLFLPTLNSTDAIVFVTPVSAPVKTAIINRINQALSTITV